MTLPEWAAIIFVGIIISVFGWGVKRLVRANDHTSVALTGINTTLGEINGKLKVSEEWQRNHEKQDDERHTATQKSHESVWRAIDNLRATG